MQVTITGLFYYPIKSCAGIAVPSATVEARGIRHDRRWMLVDSEGRFMTQREHPQMATVRPTVTDDGLLLTAADRSPLFVPLKDGSVGQSVSVTVWRDTGTACDQGDAAAEWLSEHLNIPCRLVWMPDENRRPVKPPFSQPGDIVSFADAYPLLLTTEESLADLNRRLDVPLPMDRFRPNIVVRGAEPFAEDDWKLYTVAGSEAVFRVASGCARCAVTTVDQQSGVRQGAEPLATLNLFRKMADNKVHFGRNVIFDWQGSAAVLNVGDTLAVADSP